MLRRLKDIDVKNDATWAQRTDENTKRENEAPAERDLPANMTRPYLETYITQSRTNWTQARCLGYVRANANRYAFHVDKYGQVGLLRQD